MRIDIWITLLLVVVFYPQALETASFQNCKLYTVIPESNYDKDPASLKDPTKHPNGFSYGLAKYPATSTNLNNPCVFMTNLTGHAVGVMVQAFSDNKICVKDDGGNTVCSMATISKCIEAHADTVKYEFYCDPGKGCEGDVQFWYRLVPSVGDIDDWCTDVRSGNDFPKTLLPMPSDIPTQEAPTSSATILSTTGLVNLVVLFLSYLSYRVIL